MKKILALVMALVLMCGMLVACDENAQSLLNKADAALMDTPYTATMKINFESDNAELNKIFSAMNMEVPMTVDGKNIAMDTSIDMAEYTAKIKIIIADMVMYYDIKMAGQSIKMKAPLNDEQYQEFMAENNTEMMIEPEVFGQMTVETKDGKKHITCEEISEEGLKVLNDFMAESLDNAEVEATFSNITYGIILNDGKYESMDMAFDYSITVAGETYNMTFKMSLTFSYDNVEKIVAPADADKYEEVNFDDLMG